MNNHAKTARSTTPAPKASRWPSSASKWRRWSIPLAAGLVAVLVGIDWWSGRAFEAPPIIPDLTLEDTDKEVPEAIEREKTNVRRQPRSGKAWGQLGKVLLAHGYGTQARECFVNAEQFDPEEPRWPYYRGLELLLGHGSKEGLELLRRAVKLADRSDSDNLAPRLTLAENLISLGHYKEAEAELALVARKKPKEPRLIFYQGVLAIHRGEPHRAIELLTPLAKHPLIGAKVCSQLATLYTGSNDTRRAAEYTSQSKGALYDHSWDDPYRIESVRMRVGRVARFQAAAKLRDGNQYERNAAELSRMIEAQDKDSDIAHLTLGDTLIRLGRLDEAEKSFRKALEMEPDRMRTVVTLGQLLFMRAVHLQQTKGADSEQALANYKESAKFLRQAEQLKPNDAFANLFLGRALLALGQVEEAIPALRLVCAVRPEMTLGHLYLGEALLANGQLDKARPCLEQAVEMADKANARPREALQRLVEAEKKAATKR